MLYKQKWKIKKACRYYGKKCVHFNIFRTLCKYELLKTVRKYNYLKKHSSNNNLKIFTWKLEYIVWNILEKLPILKSFWPINRLIICLNWKRIFTNQTIRMYYLILKFTKNVFRFKLISNHWWHLLSMTSRLSENQKSE